MESKSKPAATVVSLSQKRHARLTLQAFDKIARDSNRSKEEQRAEVERKARSQF